MISRENLKKRPFFLSGQQIDRVYAVLAEMTDEEKIGQLFCLCAKDFSDEMLEELFAVMHPGGVTYRPGRLEDAVRFTQGLRRRSKYPMLIAGNLEKGGNGVLREGTQLNTPLGLAAGGDPSLARQLGMVCGREGRAAGVNWSFAPIVDVNYEFRNPITNIRTFGSDPDTVRSMGIEYIKAVQLEGLAACAKHFPGDGVDERDQHLLSSVNSFSVEEWQKTYGEIYRGCIEAGVMTVMVGHILFPAWSRKAVPGMKDEDILPASLAPELMTGLLRDNLGFNGLIVTDASAMAGFTIPMRRSEAVPRSIAAGADMFLFTRNSREDYEAMLNGYRKGIISEERLNDAVTRILALKSSLGLYEEEFFCDDESGVAVGCPEHLEIARNAADRAVTLVKEEKGVIPLSPERHKRILFYPITDSGTGGPVASFREKLEKEGFEVDTFVPQSVLEGKAVSERDMKEKYDLLLYAIDLQTRSNQTVVRINWTNPMATNDLHYSAAIPTVAVSFSNPYHLFDMPRVRTYINAYSDDEYTLDAAVEKLLGRSAFIGVSPVDPFCGVWDTRL